MEKYKINELNESKGVALAKALKFTLEINWGMSGKKNCVNICAHFT